MFHRYVALIVGGLSVACVDRRSGEDRPLVTEWDSASYAVGMEMGLIVQRNGSSALDHSLIQRGLLDVLEGHETAIGPELSGEFAQRVAAAGRVERLKAQADTNRGRGEAFRRKEGARPEVTNAPERAHV